jgi:hypothetical protein
MRRRCRPSPGGAAIHDDRGLVELGRGALPRATRLKQTIELAQAAHPARLLLLDAFGAVLVAIGVLDLLETGPQLVPAGLRFPGRRHRAGRRRQPRDAAVPCGCCAVTGGDPASEP